MRGHARSLAKGAGEMTGRQSAFLCELAERKLRAQIRVYQRFRPVRLPGCESSARDRGLITQRCACQRRLCLQLLNLLERPLQYDILSVKSSSLLRELPLKILGDTSL